MVPSTRRKRALSPDRIFQAALALVDRRGLEALSMRELGRSLGVQAMSLYHHVPNKAALLEGVTDLVLAEIDLTETGGTWQDAVRRGARSFWRVLMAHPNVIPLLLRTPSQGFGARESGEATLRFFVRAGLDPKAAHQLFRIMQAFVLGMAMMLRAKPTSKQIKAARADLGETPGRYPLLEKALAPPVEIDPDADFDRGIEMLIRAVEDRRAEPARSPRKR
ncbi:MAG: TetR/AcrR family transcriptional regulator C-terminal domain-containing protein [Gemmatimonadales bacterium]